MDKQKPDFLKENIGSRVIPKVSVAKFPNADEAVQQGLMNAPRSEEAVDVLLVNPPTPDGELWIRTQHRVGRRTRENMVWPQVSLAQMAALLHPEYKVKVIDANAERLGWKEFSGLIDKYQPRYYLTQVTGPTLENDMYGCFLAKSRGAKTIAFGTHVTPMPRETLRSYPNLDYVLAGEPDLTIRDLIDHSEDKVDQRSPEIQDLFDKHDPDYRPSYNEDGTVNFSGIKGIAWRNCDSIEVNFPRPFIQNLDDMPIPMHELLPLEEYRMPLIKGPFTFIVTSRGCPAGCTYCIKHVSYQYSTRLRSPELLLEEMWQLKKLGINNIHMYADLFTVNRDQVVNLCKLMIEEKIDIKWTCNSRVDYVDEEMLSLMGQAGCWFISWGIESANEQILRNVRKGATREKAERALRWSKKAGINNWGYFIIGLPGETEETIQETIEFSKQLPLDIALFHVAAPYPGTPFFFEVVKNDWFRPGTRWEQVDMDRETVLDYPDLPAERLLYWQKRAFREWAMRPGPLFTYLKMLFSGTATFKAALMPGCNTWIGQVAISEQLRRITENPRFALFDLVCVIVSFGLWYGQPQLGWWPLIIALTPVIIRFLSGNPFLQRTPFDIVIILFLVTAGIGVWAASDQEAGWAKFWIIVSAVLLYYALAGQPRVNLWLIVGFWALVGVSFAIFFLLTHDWQIKSAKVELINQIGLWWMSVRPMVLPPDIHPNDDGGVMALMTPFLLAVGFHAWRKKQIILVILVVLGCILLISGLLLTTSLGAWIAVSAGLGIWLIWGLSGFVARKIQWSRISIFLTVILILACLSLLFIYLNPNSVIDLLDNLPGPASASSRLELFQHTADLIVDSPITGGGLRNFSGLYSQYILGIPFLYLINSHNIFLDVTLEQGIIGLLTLLIVFIGTTWILLVHEFQTEPEIRDVDLLRWAILASLLVMCLHGLVENVVYGNLGSPLVFFQAGMAISLTQLDFRFGVQNLDTPHKSSTSIRGNRILAWKFLGITALVIILFAFIFSFRKPLLAIWYANLGSVEMARVELAGWPTGKWDDGSNVALLEPAEGLFHQALSFDHNNTTANHRLGLIAMLRRDYPTAIIYLETAHQTNPDHRGIRKSLGYSYLWSGQYDQAIAFLSEFPDSMQEVGTYIRFWENLGRNDFASIARNMVTQFESIDVPMTGDNPAP